jgi:hypothetical protein
MHLQDHDALSIRHKYRPMSGLALHVKQSPCTFKHGILVGSPQHRQDAQGRGCGLVGGHVVLVIRDCLVEVVLRVCECGGVSVVKCGRVEEWQGGVSVVK